MKMAIVNRFRPGRLARVRKSLREAALLLVFAPLALAIVAGELHARDPALEQGREPVPANSLEDIKAWMNDRFTAAEIRELSPEDFRIESHACGCADKPDPHFPYLVVLFTTPKGDLLARADGQENGAKFTPLAVRKGDKYCKVDSEEQCYGSFASVCEFTDFRYGPLLKEFFPTCK